MARLSNCCCAGRNNDDCQDMNSRHDAPQLQMTMIEGIRSERSLVEYDQWRKALTGRRHVVWGLHQYCLPSHRLPFCRLAAIRYTTDDCRFGDVARWSGEL